MKNPLDKLPVSNSFSLASTILIMLVALPHWMQIRPAVMMCFTIMCFWKILSIKAPWLLGNRWIIILAALISFSISAWHYGPPLGRDPGVSFLITLLGLKIMESKSRRDGAIVLILGYFVVITHFLYVTRLPIVLYLFATAFGLTILMVQLHQVQTKFRWRQNAGLASRLLIQAIPFALILFFLFPRFAGTLWLLQSPQDRGITGMSETLTMGAIADLIESPSIAFTATFQGNKLPPPASRYWRGGVLWDTDGREWTRGGPTGPYQIDVEPIGEIYQYELEMQPTRQNWLFSMDVPFKQIKGAQLSPDLNFHKNKITNQPTTYVIQSSDAYINKTINAAQRTRGTTLTEKMLTPRIAAFVEDKKAKASRVGSMNSEHYAVEILNHFNKEQFIYTLRPPKLLSDVPVDEFLFSSRRGFCEHYATSFVTLMRAADIPARVVVGYLGGEHNPRTNQLVVRQSDAHAWAEFWNEDKGWLRVDPTAAIAPDRIENPINYDLSLGADGNVRYASLDLGFLGSLIREAKWFSALAKYKWDRWFVRFDFSKQQALLKSIGLSKVDIRSLGILAFLIGLGILITSAFLFYRKENKRPDAVTRTYQLYCKKLATQGLERRPNEGPMDFYQRSSDQFPQTKDQLLNITNLYIGLRYGKTDDTNKLSQLKQEVANLGF